MTDDIKKIIENGENNGQKPGGSDATEITNLKSSIEQEKAARLKAEKEATDLKFSSRFEQLSTIYPHAKEFQEEVRKKFDAGYEVDDAVVAILQKNEKLLTADQIKRQENKGAGMGGSAATNTTIQQSTGEKTLAELEKDFREAEARGEIKIT